jgi:hypothetical protein
MYWWIVSLRLASIGIVSSRTITFSQTPGRGAENRAITAYRLPNDTKADDGIRP